MTNKQEAFCRLLASGMSQADAYRRSHNALNMKPATVRKEAHKLMKNPDAASSGFLDPAVCNTSPLTTYRVALSLYAYNKATVAGIAD
jgi:hypothetical protein